MGFPCGSGGKESTSNAGDPGSIPGSGRSAGEGIGYPLQYSCTSLVAQLVKKSTCNAGDLGLSLGLGRSPGEGNGHPLQFSGLENSMDCIIHGVTKSQTQLSDLHFHFHLLSTKILNFHLMSKVSSSREVLYLPAISNFIFMLQRCTRVMTKNQVS